MSKSKIEVKSLVTNSKTQEYVDALVEFFESEDFEVTPDIRQHQVKAIDPVLLSIVVGVGSHAVGRYIYEPIFKLGEAKAREKWLEICHRKSPSIPLQIVLKFDDRDLEIQTIPYLVNQEWIEQFFVKLDRIMKIIDENELISLCKRIRLISQNIDDIAIVVSASDNAKPTHIITLEDESVNVLNRHQVEQFTEPETEAKRWLQYELMRAELYQQLVERLKK